MDESRHSQGYDRARPLLASPVVTTPTADEELAARQSALQLEAAALLDELGQADLHRHRTAGGHGELHLQPDVLART